MSNWNSCQNILVIRLDNIGDVLMSEPAIRAIRDTFNCKITLLTSSMAKGIVGQIGAIDDCIVFDAPWVKREVSKDGNTVTNVVEMLRARKFDGAIIFTVFSQNPVPAIMLAYLAGIPRRIAYCRENPYDLLTDWLPEKEPYTLIRHQVRRDLELAHAIGAASKSNDIQIQISDQARRSMIQKLQQAGVDLSKPWLIAHPGVSEQKRMFPLPAWSELCQRITDQLSYNILITGTAKEKAIGDEITSTMNGNVLNICGLLTLEEFSALIEQAPLVITVNTATAHLSAATKTKTIVLYALTNPQHAPWKTTGKVIPFPVQDELQSKNEVLRFVYDQYFIGIPMPSVTEIFAAVAVVLSPHLQAEPMPELVMPNRELQHESINKFQDMIHF